MLLLRGFGFASDLFRGLIEKINSKNQSEHHHKCNLLDTSEFGGERNKVFVGFLGLWLCTLDAKRTYNKVDTIAWDMN